MCPHLLRRSPRQNKPLPHVKQQLIKLQVNFNLRAQWLPLVAAIYPHRQCPLVQFKQN
jgi:hypothetical protein